MQIFLKTYNQKTVTLEVEGSDTYEEVVAKINKELDKVDPLITENPIIIINGKELIPGGVCRDIGVLKESEGLIVERMGYKNIRKKKEGWIQNLNTERFNLYNQLSRERALNETTGMYSMYDKDYGNIAEGGGKKRKSRRKGRKSKGSKRKGSKRKGSKRRRKSRRTRMR